MSPPENKDAAAPKPDAGVRGTENRGTENRGTENRGTAPKPDAAAPKAQGGQQTAGIELNIAGRFNYVPAISGEDEIKELVAKRWMPSTDDFVSVATGAVVVAESFQDFIATILSQPYQSIRRINLITHGMRSMIAFKGTIQKGTGNVSFEPRASDYTQIDRESLVSLSAPGKTWILSNKSYTIEDLRKKFASNAVIVLYCCRSGVDVALLKDIATFFKVKVIGFTDEIEFRPPAQDLKSKIFKRAGEKMGIGKGSTSVEVDVHDFRSLISQGRPILP